MAFPRPNEDKQFNSPYPSNYVGAGLPGGVAEEESGPGPYRPEFLAASETSGAGAGSGASTGQQNNYNQHSPYPVVPYVQNPSPSGVAYNGYQQHSANCNCQQCYNYYQWQQYYAYQWQQYYAAYPDQRPYYSPYHGNYQTAPYAGAQETGTYTVSAEITIPSPPEPKRGTSGNINITIKPPSPLREVSGGQTIKLELKVNTAPMDAQLDESTLTYKVFKALLDMSVHTSDNLDAVINNLYNHLARYTVINQESEPFHCVIASSEPFNRAVKVQIVPMPEINGLSLEATPFFLSITCIDHTTNKELFCVRVFENKPLEFKFLFDEQCGWNMVNLSELKNFFIDTLKPYSKASFKDNKRSHPDSEKPKKIKIKIKDLAPMEDEESESPSKLLTPEPSTISPKKKFRGNLTKGEDGSKSKQLAIREAKIVSVDQIEFLTVFYNEVAKLNKPFITTLLRELVRTKFSSAPKKFKKITKVDNATEELYSFDEYHLWLNWPFKSGDEHILMVIKGLGKGEIATIDFYKNLNSNPLLIIRYFTRAQAADYSDQLKNPTQTYNGIHLGNQNNWVIQISGATNPLLLSDLTNLAGYFYSNTEFGPCGIHFVDENFKPCPAIAQAAQHGFIQRLNPLLQNSTYTPNTYNLKYVYKNVPLDMEISRATKFHSWFLSEEAWLSRYSKPNPVGQTTWVIKVFGITIDKKNKRNEILNLAFSRRLDEVEVHDIHAEEKAFELPNKNKFFMTGNEAVNLFYEINQNFLKIKKMSLCDEARLKPYPASLYFGVTLPKRKGVYLKLVNALANGSTWYQSKFKGLTLFEGIQKTKWDGKSDQSNSRREKCLKELQQLTIQSWYNFLKQEQRRAQAANIELANTILSDSKLNASFPINIQVESKQTPLKIFDIFTDAAGVSKSLTKMYAYKQYKSAFILNQEAIEKPQKLLLLCMRVFNLPETKGEPESIDLSTTLQEVALSILNRSKSSKGAASESANNDLMTLHDLLFDEVLINKLPFEKMADQWIKHRVHELVWNSRFWHCQVYEDKKEEPMPPGLGLVPNCGAGAGSGLAR